MNKFCSKCGNSYPINEMFFGKDNSQKDGLRRYCKECMRKYDREYKTKNKDVLKEKWALSNLRRKDKRKELDKTRSEYFRQYRATHKEYAKQYRETHKEQRREYQIKNRLTINENNKKFFKTEKGRITHRINCNKRKARLKNTENSFTINQWNDCLNYFNNRCAYCGGNSKLHQDHFVPLIKGGPYSINNIIPACQRCNTSKQDNNFSIWYHKQIFYSAFREKRILKYLRHVNRREQLSLMM